MAKLIIKNGRTNLQVTKSRKYVGLKIKNTDIKDAEGVQQKRYEHLAGFKIVTLKKQTGKTLNIQLDELRNLDAVEQGTHVYTTAGSDRPMVPTGEIYVVFEKGTDIQTQLDILHEFALDIVERRSDDALFVKVTTSSPNPFKAAAGLQKKKQVKHSEPDFDIPLNNYAFSMPADTLMGHAWHLRNNGIVPDNNYALKKGADSRVIDAWQRLDGLGSTSLTIAIIDNGFDLTHPDLKDKVVKPWDLWGQTSAILQGDTRFTHGTPCASVALGSSNGLGMVGSAPNARFMPVSGTSFDMRATEDMFNYVMQNGADIISCSWGTIDSQYALNSIKEAAIANAARNGRGGKGCVILFAAGNEGQDFVNLYATHPDVICVAASTSQDIHADYSNTGPQVWISAPSNGDWPITAARAWWDEGTPGESGEYRYWADGISRGDRYKHFGGTSSATPLVAGICALILTANPALTAREVKDILAKTADKIGGANEYDSSGRSLKYGFGRVNAARAVEEAIKRKGGSTTTTPTKPTPTPTTPTQPAQPTTPITAGPFKSAHLQYPAGGFGVQTGTYSNPGNALTQIQNMEVTFRVSTFVYQGKDKLYRVVSGNFANTAAANKFLEQLKAKKVNGIVRDYKTMVTMF
jgi:subtilisin family serine protease